MRFLLIPLLMIPALSASAQQQDSIFKDYAAYGEFVDSHIMNRNFVELIQVLGGRDEYTKEQLDGLQRQFLAVYPTDFSDSAVTKVTDLGSGFRQEMRIYWNENTSYTFFYALLHDTNEHLVVLNFLLNSSSTPVLDKF